jgi:hypothetical protein
MSVRVIFDEMQWVLDKNFLTFLSRKFTRTDRKKIILSMSVRVIFDEMQWSQKFYREQILSSKKRNIQKAFVILPHQTNLNENQNIKEEQNQCGNTWLCQKPF